MAARHFKGSDDAQRPETASSASRVAEAAAAAEATVAMQNAAEATEAFFREYNQKNAERSMTAPEGVGYCLAVKTGIE